jgi:hypothetical protein
LLLFLEEKDRAPVAHTCNLSYTEGRDQEDHSLKPAQANSSQGPISKNSPQKKAGGVARGVGPEFKPQCHKKRGGGGGERKERIIL